MASHTRHLSSGFPRSRSHCGISAAIYLTAGFISKYSLLIFRFTRNASRMRDRCGLPGFRVYGRFNAANLSLRSSVERRAQGPMDRPSFLFFVRAFLRERVIEALAGRFLKLVVRLSQKPLAVAAFTV